MHRILNMDGTNKAHFDWKDFIPSGLFVKDTIAPTSFVFKNSRIFQLGGIFKAVSYLNITDFGLNYQLSKDFLNVNSSQIAECETQHEVV